MTKRGLAFEFEIPEGWSDAGGDGGVVIHGPNNEELIVSGSIVTGRGSGEELRRLQLALLENAFESVRCAASVPELDIRKPLGKEEGLSALGCWTLYGETRDGELFFGEAVVASDSAVMIATLEAPNDPKNAGIFKDFLRSVRRAAVH